MQLPLPFSSDAEHLLRELVRLTGLKILLTVTDNTSSLLSLRKKGDTVLLRMSRIFLKADRSVLAELAGFLKNSRIKTPFIREFIKENVSALPVRPPKKQLLNPQGRHHDLTAISRRVNLTYFGGKITAGITWGGRSAGHGTRRRILGSFNSRTNIIRINSALDRKTVPAYYLEFIVYHEMLHAALGVQKKNGRRDVHSKEFRKKEALFRHFEQALLWEKKAAGCGS